MTEVLAIIPARGGSKGIPRKNLKDLAGQPLAAWTIRAALDAKTITRVVVSSDDFEIIKLAKELGADAIARPESISGDGADVRDAEAHVLSVLAQVGYEPDVFVRLQPTSPLRRAFHIDTAVGQVLDGAPSIVSVCDVREHPYLVCWLGPGNKLCRSEDGPWRLPRQQYPQRYFINGAIYAAEIGTYVREGFAGRNAEPYFMPRDVSIDIDSPEDWTTAERRIAARGRI